MASKNLKFLPCSRKQTTGPLFGINKNEAEKGLDKKWPFDWLLKESLEERCNLDKTSANQAVCAIADKGSGFKYIAKKTSNRYLTSLLKSQVP